MNHYDEMRVPPDPSLAEDLRQRLHARLAGVPLHADSGPGPSPDIGPDDHEGDIIMLETQERPTDHEPPIRRRSPGRWFLVAAAAAVVALVGTVLAATGDDDDDKVDTADDTPTTAPARNVSDFDSMLEPGRYFIDPDDDPSTSLVVTYDIPAEGWMAWTGSYKQVGNAQVAVNIVTIDNLTVDACTDHRLADPPVGPTVDDLANALVALKPFEVTVPPTDVTLLGYQGKHLQLAIPEELDISTCADGGLQSWSSPYGDFTGYGHPGEHGRTEDFWILDVNGQRLVIETNQGPWSEARELAERDAIFDSIRIEP